MEEEEGREKVGRDIIWRERRRYMEGEGRKGEGGKEGGKREGGRDR